MQLTRQLARERGVVVDYPWTELGPCPVSRDVCLWIDEEVPGVDGDVKNEFKEGPYVKAVERRPCSSPDYDGWFKVELGYLWRMYGDAVNSGGLDQFLPPKRQKTGEMPIWNGSWPFDVELESMGIDERDIEEYYGGLKTEL